MASDSQDAIQAAIYTALTGDATLTALVATRIVDGPPQGTTFPYVVIGEFSGEPFDTKTQEGMDLDVTIHTWSEALGWKETADIMAAVLDALDKQSLSVTGHSLVLLQFTFSDRFLDPDGVTRHGVQRFRVVTQAA